MGIGAMNYTSVNDNCFPTSQVWDSSTAGSIWNFGYSLRNSGPTVVKTALTRLIEDKYIVIDILECPSMDYDVEPDRMAHYSYRYNTYYTGVTSSTGAVYARNLLGKNNSWRMLFSDAAEYRRAEGGAVFTSSLDPAWTNPYSNKWAHKKGGNIAYFDGSASWFSNHLISSNEWTWRTWPSYNGMKYGDQGVDKLLKDGSF